MTRLLLPALILIITLFLPVAAGASHSGEVLVFLSFDQVTAALRSVPSGLTAVSRIPEGYLLRISPSLHRRLAGSGVGVEILGSAAEPRAHAIVSFRDRNGDGLPVAGTTLRTWTDHRLVEGHEAHWALLREAGAQVVPLEAGEIPVTDLRLHLPPTLGTQYDSSIAAVISLVSDTTVREVIQRLQDFGTRYWGNANRDSVGRWIRNRFQSFGMTDVQLDSFQNGGTWQVNVVASLPGADTQDGELIVGGHHDSYSSVLTQAPGADDNASGTAAALEMARVLRSINYQPNLTMRFMTYGAEEAGLIGSRSYAQRARTAARNIKAMQNYDMIANRNTAQTDRDAYIVWYAGSEAFSNLHAAMMRMYTTLTPVFTSSYRSGSDSYSFWQQNYNAVFCIERDFSPYYHSPNDLLQYLDVAYASDIIRSGLAMMLLLDRTPPPVSGLTVRDHGTGASVDVAWDSVEVPDLYRYRVYLGTIPGVYTQSFQQTTRTRTLSGLTSGTTYYVGVSMVDLAGVEGMILERSVTPSVVPAPPVGLSVDGDSSGARVWWRANTEMDLLGYYLYYSSNGATFNAVTTTPFADTSYTTSTAGGYYFVTAVDVSGNQSAPSDTVEAPVTGVEDPYAVPGPVFGIVGAYPNPFNPATLISFEVPVAGPASLAVHDILGRHVETLVDAPVEAGAHTVRWDARARASGVYLVVLRAAGRQSVARVVLMR